MARKQIGIRFDEEVLAELDKFIAAQEVPVDRTAVIETAITKYLESRRVAPAKRVPPPPRTRAK